MTIPRSPEPAIRKSLLAWYREHRREMPWRGTRDPYRIWVSEIMLQQTTVRAVLPYYDAFLEAFPTLDALAAAPVEQVLARWSGLGYYSRARNLHRAARIVVAEHGGRFPADPKAVLALPGIGRYTVAAILSIAHDAPLAVLDGNVIRVLARFGAVAGHAKSSALQKQLWGRAQELLDTTAPGDFNQAMMELGATVCTPANPDCGRCPVARWCAARALGTPLRFPEAPPKAAVTDEAWLVALIERRERILLRRRSADQPVMPGLWELPAWPLGNGRSPGKTLQARLRADLHPGATVLGDAGRARHSIMNRRLRLHLFHAEPGPGYRPPSGWRWVPRAGLDALAMSSMVRKALGAAEPRPESEERIGK